MRKFKIFLLLLMSFSFISVVKASVDLPVPTIHIDGDYDEVREVYTSAVTITLTVDKTNHPNAFIRYKLFEGSPPTLFTQYNGPIPIQRKGNYRILFKSAIPAGDISATVSQNIRVDIPYNEEYPNVIRNNQIINHRGTNDPIILPLYEEKDKDIRGVWVSTVSNIDIGQHETDLQYKNEIISILNNVQKQNMNTVFWQVRPMNDAIYPSELAPYSSYIKGAQGLGLDWDILEFVIEESHKRGLELHAWLNPYRVANNSSTDPVSKQTLLNGLHDDNFAKQNPEMTLMQTTGATLILDPGRPEVRQYLLDVIDEIIVNYDVDGIHFDDYFYVPNNEDNQTFMDYNPDNIPSLSDWRRENVNIMVREVNDLVKSHNIATGRHIKFGISPVAIWRNGTGVGGSNTSGYSAYDSLYADTRKWVLEEWLDYICPQVYFDFSLIAAPYATIVDWWANLIESNDVDVDLIIGLGFYRYTDNTPWIDENIIVEQIRYMSQYESVKGSVMFSYRTFNRSLAPINKTIERLNEYYWTQPADFAWESDVTYVPLDDQEAIDIKANLQTLIDDANSFLEHNEVEVDTNIPIEERYLGTYYIDKQYNDSLIEAINNGINVVDTRVGKSYLNQATDALILARAQYEDNVYQGSVDLDRPDAVANLESELVTIKRFRSNVNKSNGKLAEELPEGKYYAPNEFIDALDLAISEAEAIILDETSFASEINAKFYALKDKEADVRSNLIRGTSSEAEEPGDDDDEDLDDLIDELETMIAELKTKLESVKVLGDKTSSDLPFGQKYVNEEYINTLETLIEQAELMLEDEELTEAELNQMMDSLNDAEDELDNNIVIGEKEEDYKTLLIVIGSVLVSLAIIGGVAIFILTRKKK